MPTETTAKPTARCRSCGAKVDVRLVQCPECGVCCPGCSTAGLRARVNDTPAARRLALADSSLCGKLLAMHEELGHALMEAIWEIDNLPIETETALIRMYAILDDLEQAIGRTYALDSPARV